jgi:predicted SAM-dependent methyltransferase
MIDISHIPLNKPLQIIIGAGTQTWDGWILTHQKQLDLLQSLWTQKNELVNRSSYQSLLKPL